MVRSKETDIIADEQLLAAEATYTFNWTIKYHTAREMLMFFLWPSGFGSKEYSRSLNGSCGIARVGTPARGRR